LVAGFIIFWKRFHACGVLDLLAKKAYERFFGKRGNFVLKLNRGYGIDDIFSGSCDGNDPVFSNRRLGAGSAVPLAGLLDDRFGQDLG
jgi:hypothetical protein